MRRVTIIVVLGLVAVLLGAAGLLAFWHVPAPTKQVEKILPNARFPN